MKSTIGIVCMALAAIELPALANQEGRPGKQEYDFYYSATIQKQRASVTPTLCMFRGAEYSVMVRPGVSPPPQADDYQKVGTGTYDDVLCLLPDGRQIDGKQLEIRR